MSTAIAEQNKIAAVSKAQSLAENTVILCLEYGRVSNRRKLDRDTTVIETDVDRSVLHVSVDLFDSDEMRSILNFQAGLKGQILQKCVPSFFKGGFYLVKFEAMDDVDRILCESMEPFKVLVQAFADVVEKQKEESRERLGPAFRNEYFPTPEEVKSAFSIKWMWTAMSTPASLKKISKEFFEREKQKAEESLTNAVKGITGMLASEAKGLADHMVERLVPDADGKPKVFKKNSIASLMEFLSNFNLRNVGDSEELNAQVERMRQLMEGVTPDDLRKSEQLRGDVAGGFKKVAEQLDLLIEKPARVINFQREE